MSLQRTTYGNVQGPGRTMISHQGLDRTCTNSRLYWQNISWDSVFPSFGTN